MSEKQVPSMQVPLSIPVVSGSEWEYVKECLDTGYLAAGPMLGRFEEGLRGVTGANHAIPCSSGTAALHVSLLVAGVQPGEAVIVPTLTFAATVNAAVYAGAKPVFLGCDEYLNLDPDLLSSFLSQECEPGESGPVVRATGQRVAAIVPVHVFGVPCDMERIGAVALAHGVPVVEDAAESLGSRWTDGPLAGKHTGTVGELGILSFNGNKIITTGGGGAVLTNSDAAAARVRYLIDQAKDDSIRYVHGAVGFNYRMSTIAAAIGVAQLERLDEIVAVKERNFRHYKQRLSAMPGLRLLDPPAGVRWNHWFYSLLVEPGEAGIDREGLMTALAERGVQTRPLWYPNHLQKPYSGGLAYGVERAEWFWERVLNLPCSGDLSAEQVDYVCDSIGAALEGRA